MNLVIPSVSRLMFGPTTRQRNRQLVAEWDQRFRSADVQSMLLFAQCLMRRDSILDRLGDIRVPALVMVGEEDTSLPPKYAKEIAASLPEARLVIVPSAGHLSALENPELVTAQISGFLQGLRS